MTCPYRSRLFLPSLILSCVFTTLAVGETPLHQRIDEVLAKSEIGPPASLSSDAEFLRRISLDLTGQIPSANAARNFLYDESPDKRQRLIDELFQDPRTDRHLAKVFDILFMERRADKHVKAAEWQAYLLASMRENKPFNQLAREILSADGVDPANRAAVKFYLDREDLSVNLVTRDTARVFFGRDIECAQCHDHPLISDYEQSEYYGLLAFLNRSSLFQPDAKKPAIIAETAEGTVKFKSVFTGDEGETRPRLAGEAEISEPEFKKGEEYEVKPAKNVRPIPKFSRRQKLAELATAGTNEAFNKNIANRLWAVMLGRGLVHPVDLHHSENPPASPELLELLSKEFVAMNFDIKRLLKEIALSKTYQRSFRMPGSFTENIAIARKRLPKLQAEQKQFREQAENLFESLNKRDADLTMHQSAAKPLAEAAKTARDQLAAAEKSHNEAQAALKTLQQSLAAQQEVAGLLAEASAKADLAARKLPGDQSLAKADAAISAQSAAWTEKIAGLQKQIDRQTAITKTAESQQAEAQRESQQIQAELAKAEALIQKTEAEIRTIREQRQSALAAVDVLGRDLKRMKLLVDYAEASERLQAGRETAQSLKNQFAAAEAGSTRLADELAKQKGQLTGLQSSQSETMQMLAEKKDRLTNHTQAATLVVEALTQLETAGKQLPDDKDLATVGEQLALARDHQTDRQTALEKEVRELENSVQQAGGELAAMEKTITETEADLKQTRQLSESLGVQQKTASDELAPLQGAFDAADAALAESWTRHFRVAGVEPLSPEQLGWSVLEAVGQIEQQRVSALALWNKQHPELAGKELTSQQQAERAEFIEEAARTKLAGSAAKFLPLFAANAGQPQHEFFATVEQALFLANGNDVLAWLRPTGGNLTDRLRKISEPEPLAEELYLSILTRRPTAEEVQDVTDYLNQRNDERDLALQEIAWALLTSAEFRFQH